MAGGAEHAERTERGADALDEGASAAGKQAAAEGLSERQAMVLRAVVAAYVAEASPVGSRAVSHLLAVSLSSASIRATMVELMELGLLTQPHASSGRVPTNRGLELFARHLVEPLEPGAYQQRFLARVLDEAQSEGVAFRASQVLSESTRQLGFVVPPRIEAIVLRHVSLVRVASDRVLAVLLSASGQAHRRVVADDSGATQAELDRMAALLNEWAAGSTLPQARRTLERELERLRSRAGDVLMRAVRLGLRALDPEAAVDAAPIGADIVIATRLALLDQPEFGDPRRLRALFEAIETRETLSELLARVLTSADGVSVALGAELAAQGLEDCALVAAPIGPAAAAAGESSVGAIGVIGPSRMDYGRVMGWVELCSRLVADRFCIPNPASRTGAQSWILRPRGPAYPTPRHRTQGRRGGRPKEPGGALP